MNTKLLIWAYLLCPLFVFAQSTNSQPTIHYQIAFPNAIHHEAEVSIHYSNLPKQPLIVTMSASSPGRYAIHNFGKNVYNVKAYGKKGQTLKVKCIAPATWQITQHAGTVDFHYTLYADRADGTYAEVDDTHAHLNMPATFMWAKGLEKYPITIQFHTPPNSNWKVASQLQTTATPFIFIAPDLQYFMDSPTKLSDFSQRSWTVKNPDKRKLKIQLAVTHDTTEDVIDKFAIVVQKVVLEQQAIYKELPLYDFGNYTFICDYRTGIYRDGMEHRNSTILTSGNSLKNNIVNLMSTLSHEFFHCWNVERLRPASLEPFDFEHANMCEDLWFAEGFTSYYDDLVLCRAKVYTLKDYLARISHDLNYVLNQPATGLYSPVDMSQRATFVDAASNMDRTNFQNCHTSYYPFGSVIGLALDLELRSNYGNVTLDDYMQALWQTYGKKEIPFTSQNLEEMLAKLTQDKAFAAAFFQDYIYGTKIHDYTALLANAGLLLQKKYPQKAYMHRCNLSLQKGKGLLISSNTIKNSPLYLAGLDIGDILTTLDGVPLDNVKVLEKIISSHTIGDKLEVRYLHRGKLQKKMVVLQEHYQLEVLGFEEAGLPLSQKIKHFRQEWLESKVD